MNLHGIIFDLAGNGIKIDQLSTSQKFIDSNGDGLLHRTAWAGSGNGVLFYDPDGRNAITEDRQYIFTKWDPTATSDMDALRSAFDSNGDGKLTAADAEFAKFKVEVTNADGSTSVKTLEQLGITEINLSPDATSITLPDGSSIQGQTTYTKSDGTTGTVADTVLATDATGRNVVQTASSDASGTRAVDTKAYDSSGTLAFAIHSVTNATGTNIENDYDDNGDGQAANDMGKLTMQKAA